MSEELKPCPFCGEQAALHSDWKHNPDHRYYWVICVNDDCAVECFTDSDCYIKESAIKTWNIRHTTAIEARAVYDVRRALLRINRIYTPNGNLRKDIIDILDILSLVDEHLSQVGQEKRHE